MAELRRSSPYALRDSPAPSLPSSMEPPFHILVGTWNVGGCSPSPSVHLQSWLQPRSARAPIDMYVVGLQEAQSLTGVDALRTDRSKGKLWERHLADFFGPNYDLLVHRQLTGIVMLVFVRSKHLPHISALDVSYAATGFLNQGNKGGVAARFVMYNHSISIVVAHLSANDDNVKRRREDYLEIVRKAVFTPAAAAEARSPAQIEFLAPRREAPEKDGLRNNFQSLLSAKLSASPSGGTTSKVSYMAAAAATVFNDLKEGGDSKALGDPDRIKVLDHDLVIWLGDLNFRIDASPEQVIDWVESENWESLQAADQLNKERSNRNCFKKFEEAPIRFAPTYKMHRSRNAYARGEDGELKRTPSYTDRVLWYTRSKPTNQPVVNALDYHSAPILSSDHRPVYCLLAVRFSNGSPTISPSELTKVSAPPRPSPRRSRHPQCEIDFSHDIVDFGELPHRFSDRRYVTIENFGKNEASMKLPTWQELPDWLRIPHQNAVVPAGGKAKLILEVCLARDKQYRDGMLDTTKSFHTALNILVVPMHVKHRLEVRFCARNSCYALPLGHLILYRTPMALVQNVESDTSSTSSSSSSSASSHGESVIDLDRAPLPVPKEMWQLVDALSKGNLRGSGRRSSKPPSMFLRPATTTSWLHVIRALDYGYALDSEPDDIAVGSCLLQLLSALPDPVLSRDAYAIALGAARARDVRALSDAFRALPFENFNLLIYICTFLADISRPWSSQDTCKVALLFADTMLLGRKGAPTQRLKERSELLMFVVEEYESGRFVPEIVVDLSGSLLWPAHDEVSRSKKWKKKASKKMKKVFR